MCGIVDGSGWMREGWAEKVNSATVAAWVWGFSIQIYTPFRFWVEMIGRQEIHFVHKRNLMLQ